MQWVILCFICSLVSTSWDNLFITQPKWKRPNYGKSVVPFCKHYCLKTSKVDEHFLYALNLCTYKCSWDSAGWDEKRPIWELYAALHTAWNCDPFLCHFKNVFWNFVLFYLYFLFFFRVTQCRVSLSCHTFYLSPVFLPWRYFFSY